MAGTLDQSYTTTNDSNGMRTGGTTNLRYAQSFIPSFGGGVSEIRLGLNGSGSPTGNIWTEIWTDSATFPGAIIGTKSANVNVATIGGSFPTPVEVTFTFSAPPSITAGTTYWIVLDADYTVSGTNFVFVYNNNPGGYASGKAAVDSAGSWSDFGTRDLYFKEYYLPASNGKFLMMF